MTVTALGTIGRAVGALLAAGALAGGVGSAPSAAADPMSACAARDGVVVVVDFAELGGGVQKGCSAAGGTASQLFQAAGFPLGRVAVDQSFVCQVSGLPDTATACDDTPPPDAYWSLWTSDGTSGTWGYATRGVDALRVPEGQYVAFAWHQGSGRASAPDVVPTPRTAPKPAPTSSDTRGSGGPPPSDQPATGGSAHPSATATTTAQATMSASATASAKVRPTPSTTSARPTPSSSGPPSIDDIPEASGPETGDVAHTDDGSGPFPTWAVVGLGVGVLGAAGAVPLIRRRLG